MLGGCSFARLCWACALLPVLGARSFARLCWAHASDFARLCWARSFARLCWARVLLHACAGRALLCAPVLGARSFARLCWARALLCACVGHAFFWAPARLSISMTQTMMMIITTTIDYYSCGLWLKLSMLKSAMVFVSRHCGHPGGISKNIWDSSSRPHR